jgi:hypothetical protein
VRSADEGAIASEVALFAPRKAKDCTLVSDCTLNGATRPRAMANEVAVTISRVVGLTQVQELVILFVLLPIVVAVILVPLMVWRLSKGPRPILTSELLAHGIPADGKVLTVRSLGNVLDSRPMVRFQLEVTGGTGEEPFELEVVQSFPRSMVNAFQPGDIVRLRLSPDRSVGAIEWGYEVPER